MNLSKEIKEYLNCNYWGGEDRSGTDDKIILTPDQLQKTCEDLIAFLIEFEVLEMKEDIMSKYELATKETLLRLAEERDKYQEALNEIMMNCRNPNAIDACRLIFNKCQEVLNN